MGTNNHATKKKKVFRINAREALEGVNRKRGNFREREASKLQDSRLTKVDGMWRLKQRREWVIQTRHGEVTLVTSTGGFEKTVRTRKGRRRFFAAWREVANSLHLPKGMTVEQFVRNINTDLVREVVELPYWKLRHLRGKSQPIEHRAVSHEEWLRCTRNPRGGLYGA